ncbi:FtsW/RodA/SpoVE family cell cycle protein [Thermodesulfobium sp.]|uniref:Rod shape-determining protein RodA n=1 Tax=Thermodesulfobium narugense TaxID=184064 RepID=A0A7C5KBC6_9BACT
MFQRLKGIIAIIDFKLFLMVTALIIWGIVNIYSVTYSNNFLTGGNKYIFVIKQFVWYLISVFLMLFFSYIGERRIFENSKKIYFIGIFILLFTVVFGQVALGSRRWLSLGPFSFQPSEFLKLLIAIHLSKIFSSQNKAYIIIFSSAIYSIIPFIIVSLQPDLGTALSILFLWFVGFLFYGFDSIIYLVFFAILISFFVYFLKLLLVVLVPLMFYIFMRLRKNKLTLILILFLTVLSGISGPIGWNSLHTYQKERLLSFVNPFQDPTGAGYHIIQSQAAVVSGGLFGKGFLNGAHTQLHFIPEQHTDFIFSAIVEEWGLVGGFLTLLLEFLIVLRILKIGFEIKGYLGYFCILWAFLLSFHTFVNVGMVLGIMPVTGIPLPFVSYGGTFLMTNFIALGLISSIYYHNKNWSFK